MKRVIVTRPASEAVRWTQALLTQGWQVEGWPLIDIVAPLDRSSLVQARHDWATFDAVMFVSAAAVEHFFAAAGVAADAGHARYWAPGPGTARALVAAGTPPERIDAPPPDAEQFDSEALWAVVAGQVSPGVRILVVRGSGDASAQGEPGSDSTARGQGRDWLAQRCQEAGARVDWCVAYRRQRPTWSSQRCAQARTAASDGSIWLFSSSEAIAHLQALLPGQDWHAACALTTHPRIAQAARALGVGSIHQTRPALTDVVRALESLN